MKHNRNSHSGFGLPLFISFNELAWLAVVGVVLIAAPQLAKGKQQSPNPPEEKEQPQESELTLTEKNKLRDQLKEAEQELAQAKDQLEEAEQKLENKNADATFRNAELIRKIDTLEKQLKETKQELAKTQNQLEETKQKLEVAESKKAELLAKIDALEKQWKSMEQEQDWLLAEKNKLQDQLNKARQKLEVAESEKTDLLEKIDALKKQLQNQPVKAEQVVRKELLGLKGELEYVGLLLDRSSSMKNDNRWEKSIKVVETWLQHLPIENSFLIHYNHEFNTLPANLYLPVSGPNGERNRKWLIQHIQDVQPAGGTHTIEALAKAYKDPKLQTIILFTDGEPRLWDENSQGRLSQNKTDEGNYQTGRSVSRNMKEILQLCRDQKQRRGVTVNVVAIGDYFDEEFGEFLRNVAKETDGAFIGR